jgi:stage II sporulation protein D
MFVKRSAGLLLALAFLLTTTLFSCSPVHTTNKLPDATLTPDDIDAALQHAAVNALGDREGTIIVMDPQNGRLRAVVNPRLAFEQAFPPGSAIKPFTALAALRAGLIDAESRTACRRRYALDGFQIVCSHPKSEAPFDLPHALAYSCNYYFARLGERLSQSAFDSVLLSFGFGSRTGVGAGGESAGSVPRGEWRPSMALGEGDALLVTPIQLVTAYCALASGGRLYRPQRAAPDGFVPRQTASINLAPAQLSRLIMGMRGAVVYGTAAPADLASLPVYVFGKTGTSAASDGFRTQGWFVGISERPADPARPSQNTRAGIPIEPEQAGLAVLVFLRRSHGSECAAVARDVFAEYASVGARAGEVAELDNAGPDREHDDAPSSALAQEPALPVRSNSEPAIRVHLVTQNVTPTLSLEDYVRGAVAGEASIETEPEALKAQAVVSRTFALKNLGRHSQEGYDFCSTTHCQRYLPSQSSTAARAAAATSGQVLSDEHNQLVDAYFHAACGGMTANIGTLWGVAAPAYLRGVRDDYCAAMPHHSWTQPVPSAMLQAALKADPRSDTGSRLDNIAVVKRDATGRAELVQLEGARRRTVSGWEFKMVVGRGLGWNILKSSRFQVSKQGASYVFRGSGFGHGLGMCQEGAHVMAHRGASYRQILNHYYPGTTCTGGPPWPLRSPQSASSPSLSQILPYLSGGQSPFGSGAAEEGRPHMLVASWAGSLEGSRRLTLSSDHFHVAFSQASETPEIEKALAVLEAARTDMLARLSTAYIHLPESSGVEVVFHATTQAFVASTGEPGWAAGVTLGHRIELQPLALLRRRGIVATTLRHEYTHYVIELLSRGKAPHWLAEGLAAYFAGEGRMLGPFEPRVALSPDEIERRLAVRSPSSQDMRRLYAAAYQTVISLIHKNGEPAVWARVANTAASARSTPLIG